MSKKLPVIRIIGIEEHRRIEDEKKNTNLNKTVLQRKFLEDAIELSTLACSSHSHHEPDTKSF